MQSFTVSYPTNSHAFPDEFTEVDVFPAVLAGSGYFENSLLANWLNEVRANRDVSRAFPAIFVALVNFIFSNPLGDAYEDMQKLMSDARKSAEDFLAGNITEGQLLGAFNGFMFMYRDLAVDHDWALGKTLSAASTEELSVDLATRAVARMIYVLYMFWTSDLLSERVEAEELSFDETDMLCRAADTDFRKVIYDTITKV